MHNRLENYLDWVSFKLIKFALKFIKKILIIHININKKNINVLNECNRNQKKTSVHFLKFSIYRKFTYCRKPKEHSQTEVQNYRVASSIILFVRKQTQWKYIITDSDTDMEHIVLVSGTHAIVKHNLFELLSIKQVTLKSRSS